MLMELYDEQEVLRSYVESEKYEAENATKIATARRLLKWEAFHCGDCGRIWTHG